MTSVTSGSRSTEPVTGDARNAFGSRCDTVEESYEFMLAYAARGVAGDETGGEESQIRHVLRQCDRALDGIDDALIRCIDERFPESADLYRAFAEVVAQDARSARAVLQVALAQRAISSQLVDSVNVSSHVRAVLTDMFLIEEILKI
jgi:hypothetical protein